MDSSFPEPASGTQKHPKRFLMSLTALLAGIINGLADLIKFTEEERAEAGIYLDRPGGE